MSEEETLGIEVILNEEGLEKAPSCPHGPTLLFVKASKGVEQGRRFYACSACRDRRDCNFFQWEDEKVSEVRLLAREENNKIKQPPYTHQEYLSRYRQFISLPLAQKRFCRDCQLLLLPDEWTMHTAHQILADVSLAQLRRPNLFATLGFVKVLCVGTPRLHELIKMRNSAGNNQVMKSLLLDIDFRKYNGTPCIVTNSCRNIMTRFGCPDYSLSHQLLYFMFGEMRGCYNILQGERRESRANLTDHDYKMIFCSNMMKCNVEFENNGFPIQRRDIFMENIMLCGMAGFSDFYKPSWLRRILTWQDSDLGCFKKDEKERSHGLDRNLLGTTNSHKRVKRREKTLKDGCYSHMTAVAVSTLGGYMNFYQTEQDTTKRPLT